MDEGIPELPGVLLINEPEALALEDVEETLVDWDGCEDDEIDEELATLRPTAWKNLDLWGRKVQ